MTSNQYPQHMFLLRNKKKVNIFGLKKKPPFLELLLSICSSGQIQQKKKKKIMTCFWVFFLVKQVLTLYANCPKHGQFAGNVKIFFLGQRKKYQFVKEHYNHRQLAEVPWKLTFNFYNTIRIDDRQTDGLGGQTHWHPKWKYITKTCLYKFDPLKPHFYIVKLGFTGVYIIFHISAQNIDCGYSLEPPHQGSSNKYPQSMFWAEIWQILEFLYLKIFSFWRWNFLYIWIGVFS